MRESEVEQHFIWTIAMCGGHCWKTKAIGRVGFPDRVALIPGETWLVELKQPKGRLGHAQAQFAADCANMRVNYACLWSIPMINEWAKGRGFSL